MLNRIEARNFKSFKHLDYKCAKLNLLTGLNGAGKSSFVQLMLKLRALSTRGSKAQVEIDLKAGRIANKFADIKYCYAGKDEPIMFDVEFIGSSCVDKYVVMESQTSRNVSRVVTESASSPNNILVWHPEAFEAYKQYMTKRCNLQHDLEGEKIDYDKFWDLDHEIESALKAKFDRIEKGEKQIQDEYEGLWRRMRFIEAFRKRPQEVHGGRDMPQSMMWVISNDVRFDPEGGDIAEFLYKYGKSLKLLERNPLVHPKSILSPSSCGLMNEGKESALIEQVNAWLGEISPEAKFCVERYDVGDDEEFVVKICFGDEEAFKPQNVGLGISYVLPVLGTILTAWSTSIIIIENPEAHIHPKGQAKLGELIARAAAYGVQVFVETHSDHVINGVRVAVRDGILKPEDVNIAFFERKEHLKDDAKDSDDTEIYSEIRNIKVDVNGSLSEYPEDFMDEWNNQLLELM